MKTSDKELDDLFNSKLQHLEAGPSADLWQNIAAELDQKPKKKNSIFVLRIAASILIILSVGLFWLKPQIEPVKKALPQKVVKLKLKPMQPKVVQPDVVFEPQSDIALNTKKRVVKEASAHRAKLKALALKPLPEIKIEVTGQTLANIPAQNKPVENVHSTRINPSIVPDRNTILKVQPVKTDNENEPVKEALVFGTQTNKASVNAKRRGIRNVGDLINLVMAKVDKRQDKLIEFTNRDDGDESNITGINLGIISIKKEK